MSRDNRNDFDYNRDWLNDMMDSEMSDIDPTPIPRRTARTPSSASDNRRQSAADDYEAYAARSRRSSATRRPTADDYERAQMRGGARRRSTGAPLIILVVVLVLGMLFAAWQLGSIFLNYQRDRSAYNDLAAHAISGLAEADESTETGQNTQMDAASVRVVSEVPIDVDWSYLRSINDSIAGWLYCPTNTIINYPVVQSSDHDFYLDHGFDKSSNTSGTLFADMDSVTGVTLSNLIIYGHNMKDNSMFGSFQSYVDRSFYEENPVFYYLTPTGNYRIELFGCHMVEGTTDNFPVYFSNEDSYRSYVDSISSHCYWFEQDKVNLDYQMMTMSTCTSGEGYEDARLLLHGVMIPIQ